MQQRSRSKTHSFEDRLAEEKGRAEEELAGVSHGPQRDALVKKIRRLETASHLTSGYGHRD
jgi:hypothetical protein